MGENFIIDYDGCGIYALFNLRTKKVYVGKSSNVKKRLKQHYAFFKQKSQINKMYSEDVNDFVTMLIQEIPRDLYDLFGNAYEIAYMLQIKSWEVKLYNINPRKNTYHEYYASIAQHFCGTIDTHRHVIDSFLQQCNVKPWNVKYIDEESAQKIKGFNAKYKQDLKKQT